MPRQFKIVFMNRKVVTTFSLTGTLLILFFACSKSRTAPEGDDKNNFIQNQLLPPNCAYAPDYGSTILCAKWIGPGKDHVVEPKSNPGPGKYFAWPKGLMIDPVTGAINVTQSESGARYQVGFLKDGYTDTCFTEIIIGGVTYLDGIYVMAANDTLALPWFDANPVRMAVCDDSADDDYPKDRNNDDDDDDDDDDEDEDDDGDGDGDDDDDDDNDDGNGDGNVVQYGGNSKCEFDDDEDDDNGNGSADEPLPGQQANDMKVRVRTVSGIINLKKSLKDGAFGSNPKNGQRREVTIYYRLNDCSQKALRKIKVNLIYYERKSDIPVQLVNQVESNRTNFMQARIVDKYGKPRPPQIFVTRFY